MKRISFETIFQLQSYFAEMPVEDRAVYCILLQESNNKEFRQFGLDVAGSLTEEQIIASFMPLIGMKASHHQAIRDLVSKLLARVSSEGLDENFFNLVELVYSDVYFVREESLLLLDKIKPEFLLTYFDYLRELEKKPGNFDTKRIIKSLILKIVKAWTIAQKTEHYDYAVELQGSSDKQVGSIGDLLVLQIMDTWETEKLKVSLPFFISHTDTESNEVEVSEIASFLALRVLLASDSAIRMSNFDYMTGFNYYGNKIVRRLFRSLALETMALIDEEYLPNYALFLLQCLEGKSKIDRKLARGFLEKLDPNKLPVRDLLYFRSSGLWRARRACKSLLNQISEEVLFNNLEIFIDLQKSITPNVRYFASQLATSISIERLRAKKALLEDCAKSRDVFVADLAEALLYLI